MKKLLTALTPLALIGIAGGTPVHAAVIAGWNEFNTNTATFPVVADTVAGNIASTGLDTNNLTRIGSPQFALSGWNTGSAVDLAEYIELSLQPSGGFEVDFTNFQLNASRLGPNLDLVLRSSIDGFTSNLGSTVDLTFAATTYTIDLSALPTQTSLVQFRLYGINATSPGVLFSGSNSGSVDGNGFVAINGTVSSTGGSAAIPFGISPIPGLALLGVGYGANYFWKWRKDKGNGE